MECGVINLALLATDLYLWSAGGERGSGFVAGTVPWAYSRVIGVDLYHCLGPSMSILQNRGFLV